MLIPLKTFTGEIPRTSPHLLPDTAAQSATDCNFIAGSLCGVPGDAVTSEFGAGVRSIFAYNGINKFSWTRDVDAVRSPVVNDRYNRFYWSDDSGFYVSPGDSSSGGEPATRYLVGVPPPSSPLSVSAASFALPGMDTSANVPNLWNVKVATTLLDERADGTFDDTTKQVITPNWTLTGTSATLTFTARAPKPTTNTTTTATTAPTGTTGTPTANSGWSLGNLGVFNIGNPSGPVAQMYRSGITNAFYYNDGTGSAPSSILVYQTTSGGGDMPDVVTPYSYARMGATYWYTNGSSLATPPSNDGPATTTTGTTTTSTTTTVSAPYVGAAVELVISLWETQGSFVKAIIRTDSSKTTWPAEVQGVTGTLKYDGPATGNGTYTLSIASSASSVETRAYTYTYVNQYQEEGPPARPVEITCASDAVVRLGFTAPPSGFCPIYKVRLYRTGTGSTANYLYVGEFLTSAGTTILDNVKTSALGHTLDTNNYFPPYVTTVDSSGNITGVNSSATIKGVKAMANGILVGFRGNEVWFSEPYLPYAWSPSAIKPLPHRVVGLCPFENGLYVTTTAEPYIIMGAAPEYMTDSKVVAVQAGVSKNSIVNSGNGVIYASQDGLVELRGTNASLDMSHKFFTRQEWQERYGSKLSVMGLAVHDSSLLGYFTDGTPGFLIRFDEEVPSFVKLSARYVTAYKYDLADALLVSTLSSVNYFRGTQTTTLPFIWQSKDFILPKPINMAALQLVGSGVVGFEIYADGVLKHSVTNITLNENGLNVFRLPSGFLSRRWSVKLTGAQNADIKEAYLTTSIQELQDV